MERARQEWGPDGVAEAVRCRPVAHGTGKGCTAPNHDRCHGGRPYSYRVGTREGVVFRARGVSGQSFEDAFRLAGVALAPAAAGSAA